MSFQLILHPLPQPQVSGECGAGQQINRVVLHWIRTRITHRYPKYHTGDLVGILGAPHWALLQQDTPPLHRTRIPDNQPLGTLTTLMLHNFFFFFFPANIIILCHFSPHCSFHEVTARSFRLPDCPAQSKGTEGGF